MADAIRVVGAIIENGGTPVTKDQLAAAMKHPTNSGAFLAKVHGARLFGVVEFVSGKIAPTQLGFEITDKDEVRAKAAKVKAFLNVPLFERTALPWTDPENFNPGYLLRGLHLLPKRGDKPEWQHSQDHWEDAKAFPAIDLRDPIFVYG